MRKAILLIALAALAAPAAAAAASIDLDGKAVDLAARGFVRGELTASTDAKPVLIRVKGGYVRVVDLGGDLEVRCEGSGKRAERKNDEGQTVVLCAGRGGRMAISGSHFRLNAFALRMQLRIPEGYTGKLGGNLHRAGEAGGEGAVQQAPGDRQKPAGGREGPVPPAPAPAADDPVTAGGSAG